LRAQDQDEFKTRPKKAVFDAYDAIFAEHGLHTNHDRACLRLLFQLVGPDADPRASLYEKFEQLLSRAGITLDRGDEEVSVVPSEGPMLHEAQGTGEYGGAAWQASPKRPQRRNSFTSMYDVTAEIERLSKRRSLSRASSSHVQVEKSPFHGRRASARPALGASHRRSYASQDYFSQHNELVGRHRLNRNEEQLQSPLNKYDGQHLAQDQYLGYNETEEFESSMNGFDQDPGGNGHALPIIPVSQTQLVRDSGAFDQGRIRILSKKYLRKWFLQTHEQINKFLDLEAEAAQRDRLTLQHQAFDSWLAAHQRIRQEERVKQHFNALNRRAAAKYDGYLKAKAFRHWHQTMLETKANTEFARQRYLYVKYFNAWHQLTVTNELKAERQSLKAPFQLLRTRAAQYYQDEVDALELYYSNLSKMIFWRWAFAYADRKAPRIRDTVLAERTLLAWRATLRERDEQEREAAALFERNVVRRILRLWSTQTRIDIAGDHQANAFRMQSLTKRALVQWKLATQLAPLESRVARMRDWRVARSGFSVWLLKTRMVFRADWVNTLRTKQNAFTAWNERLRQDAVQARIDNRILAQAMYKWVIAQRAILMTRIRQEREKSATFTKLLAGFRKHRCLLQSQEAQVKNQRFARLAKSTLECWKLQMNLTTARSQMAIEFHTPKIQQDTLAAWCDRHEHVQKLEKWAKDAIFYFIMMKTLKRWRDVASDAKKRRTNDVYKKVRKQVKMNLARKALVKWRNRVDEIKSLDERCERSRRSKDTDLLRGLMVHWQSRHVQRQHAMADAFARFDGRLLTHSLHAWIDASRQAINLQIRADQFYHIHLSELCSAKVRRLSMKAFGMKRRQQDADAMRERHWSKHVRNILKHWATQSKDVTYQALVRGSSEPTDAGYGTASQDDPPGIGTGTMGPGATQRAEDWTAFDADLLDNDDWLPSSDAHEPAQANSTPMPTPGYLNTPSKRAARAKALAKMSTTPATPLTMPFAARLRAGMATSPVPGGALSTAGKDGVGRSGLGVTVQTAGGDREDLGYENR
jgi:protein SFI1